MGDATKNALDFLDFPPFRITFKLLYCSHQPHRSNQSINLVIWGIILEFRTIQFTWPMRLVDFNLGPEKMASKVKKSGKNQGPIFMFFFTLRAIFSGLRSKLENCIGHVNCVVLSYRMMP